MSLPPSRHIQSPQNPSFKLWRRWMAHPEASDCPWIPLEGEKQIQELLARQPAELLLVAEPALESRRDLITRSRQVVILPERLIQGLSEVRSSQGMIAFFDKPRHTLEDLPNSVIYLDGLQDPGNLGTVLRTAAAAGGCGVVTAPDTVSCFNAKVVRASAGYLFVVPFLERCSLEPLLDRGYLPWVADPSAGIDLFSAPLVPPLVVVIGREGGRAGSPPDGSTYLRIPMESGVESLNAGVSAALILYELKRRAADRKG